MSFPLTSQLIMAESGSQEEAYLKDCFFHCGRSTEGIGGVGATTVVSGSEIEVL